jgi:hypothetical protein
MGVSFEPLDARWRDDVHATGVRSRGAALHADGRAAAAAETRGRGGYQREGVMRSIHVKADQRADAVLWSRLPGDPD